MSEPNPLERATCAAKRCRRVPLKSCPLCRDHQSSLPPVLRRDVNAAYWGQRAQEFAQALGTCEAWWKKHKG